MVAPKHVDFTVSDDEQQRTQELISLVRAHTIPQFALELDDSKFHVSILAGGITNQLYRVRIIDGPSVVARVFGKNTERIISRESELFYQSIFLTTYAQGHNFLLYRFLDGFRDIPFTEMPTLRKEISRSLAEFHFHATCGAKRDVGEDGVSRWDKESITVLHSLKDWASQCFADETRSKLSAERQAKIDSCGITQEAVAREVETLSSVLKSLEPTLALGVCHNDLLCANIMRKEPPGPVEELFLIDFEYSNKNFVLYDFANHFNEYVGLECHYDKFYPSREVIADCMVEYRTAMRGLLQDCSADDLPFPREFYFSDSDDEECARVQEWVNKVQLLSLASNLNWTVWSVLQAAHSVIDFDFAWYAGQRWRRYLATRNEFLDGVAQR